MIRPSPVIKRGNSPAKLFKQSKGALVSSGKHIHTYCYTHSVHTFKCPHIHGSKSVPECAKQRKSSSSSTKYTQSSQEGFFFFFFLKKTFPVSSQGVSRAAGAVRACDPPLTASPHRPRPPCPTSRRWCCPRPTAASRSAAAQRGRRRPRQRLLPPLVPRPPSAAALPPSSLARRGSSCGRCGSSPCRKSCRKEGRELIERFRHGIGDTSGSK